MHQAVLSQGISLAGMWVDDSKAANSGVMRSHQSYFGRMFSLPFRFLSALREGVSWAG